MAKAAADKAQSPERADYVVYVQAPGIREITKDDWATLGVEHDTVRWDAKNNWAVRVDEIGVPAEVLSNIVSMPANGFEVENREVPPPVIEEATEAPEAAQEQ